MFQIFVNGKGNRFWTTAAGAAVVSMGIAILALIPLIYYDALPITFRKIRIGPPPKSSTPAAVKIVDVRRVRVVPVRFNSNRLYLPTTTPDTIVPVQDTSLPPIIVGDPGGVPGGIPGGMPDFGAPDITEPPPPPIGERGVPEPEPVRIFVGGSVQSARLISQPRPGYPPLARQARVQGTVRLEAVINRDGTIENLRVLSGHALLIPAALDAVRQWRYQPTMLNGEPVEVVTTVDVNFTLGP